jgi:hypothetical protein
MSTSKFPPNFLCVSASTWPPEKACLFIFFLIYFGVSFKNIAELGSLELIFLSQPCRAGKNLEYKEQGLGKLSFYAMSLVILK